MPPSHASAPECPARVAPPIARTLAALQAQHPHGQDLWVFGYASLIWRPEFDALETHRTHVHGWHRSLKMWSRINRGSPDCPGLVFALLHGGSCQGLVYRREMPMSVYEPRWLPCPTPRGSVRALGFTLAREHPSYTGALSDARLREIFRHASGRFGSTREYALQTLQALRDIGIEDRALARLIRVATR